MSLNCKSLCQNRGISIALYSYTREQQKQESHSIDSHGTQGAAMRGYLRSTPPRLCIGPCSEITMASSSQQCLPK